MATESDYIVKDAKTVLQHLGQLVGGKCLITAFFGDNKAGFITTIVELDKGNKRLCLDCGPSDCMDQQLLASDKVLFRTEYDGIKVSFSGKSIKKIQSDGYWVFSMPIPDTIFWMQRRKYHRIKIPLAHTSTHCRLTLKTKANGREETHTATFPLYDMSTIGFSFLNDDAKWAPYLQPDTPFSHCSLQLHNGQQAQIDFLIKNNVKMRSLHGHFQDKIGCMLKKVSASFETNIQHYLQDIEVQHKLLLDGDK